MKLRSLFLGIGLLIAIAILVLQRSQISKLTADLESLRQEHEQPTAAETSAASTSVSNTAAADQSAELLRLRAQVTALRAKTNEMAKLETENVRMRAALESARKNTRTADENEPPPTEERRQAIARLNDARTYVMGFILHADENQHVLATNFDQIAAFIPKDHPPTGTNEFEILFQGSRDGVTNGSSIILLRERQPRQAPDGGWSRAYGFLDGHSEVHREPTSNFDAFERQHVWPPLGQ